MLLAKWEHATFLQQLSRATLHASVQILCQIRELPLLVIDLISIPRIAPTSSEFVIGTTSGQSCPNPMVMFDLDA
jgi:hypothetical protein